MRKALKLLAVSTFKALILLSFPEMAGSPYRQSKFAFGIQIDVDGQYCQS
jgi:hypothetical protein